MAEPVVNKADSGGATAMTPLYLANLDANVADLQLYDLFSRIGDVVSVRVFRNWSSGLSLGYGYVNYANPQCAQRALEKLNFTPVNGKPIKITLSHQEHSISKAIAELNVMLLKGKKVFVQPYLSKQERELLVDKEKFTNVFIKNFCKWTTEEDLVNIFGEFGLITSAKVMRNNDGTSKCFGFVNFANSKDAARAVESLYGKIFEEKKWYVGRTQKKFERQQELRHEMECVKEAFDKGSNLYVKNLDDGIGDKKLKEIFSPFGSVTSCGVMQDEKGISTGIGMVAFSSPEEASRAISEMNGKILGGKPLYVALALRKEDRRARLQNLEKGIDHEAVPETLSSFQNILSCEVAADASDQSVDRGFERFADEESAGRAIEVHNGVSLNKKQVCEGTSLSKQEKELSLDKTGFTIVYVKNFCESTTEDELKHIFGEFGEITSTMVMRNEDGTSKCLGYVCFKNTVDAARAVESLDGQKFGNKKWHVRRAHQKSGRQLEQIHDFEQLVQESIDKGSNLHVNNLDQSIDDEKLKELFSAFGSVTSCRVMLDKNGISKRRGFVAFSSPEEASSALSEMNGTILVGKPIHIALAQRKDDRITQLQNLDKEIDHKALHGMLSSSCKVSADASGQSMGNSCVYFADAESAQEAIRELNGIVGKLNDNIRELNGIIKKLNGVIGELNGMLLNGKKVYAGPFLNKKENRLLVYKGNLSNVFVENFCDTTTEDDLKNIFGEFGPITSAVVMRNEDGTSKCFGIVSFENAEDAAKAVESLKGQKYNKKSYVGRALKEPERQLELKHHSEKRVKRTVVKESNLCVKNPGDRNGGRRLSEVFSPFRSVTSCKVMCNHKRINRGSDLVALSSPEEASRSAVPSTTAGPLMPNMVVSLVPQQPLGGTGRPSYSSPMDKGLQTVPAISKQPIPVGPFASFLLANASPLGRGRCLVRLLNNWSPR